MLCRIQPRSILYVNYCINCCVDNCDNQSDDYSVNYSVSIITSINLSAGVVERLNSNELLLLTCKTKIELHCNQFLRISNYYEELIDFDYNFAPRKADQKSVCMSKLATLHCALVG